MAPVKPIATTLSPVEEITLNGRTFYVECNFATIIDIRKQFQRNLMDPDGMWTIQDLVSDPEVFIKVFKLFLQTDDLSVPEEAREWQKKVTERELAMYVNPKNLLHVVAAMVVSQTLAVQVDESFMQQYAGGGESPQTPVVEISSPVTGE